jgi:Tripartite tricarboxylate transporter family receptor
MSCASRRRVFSMAMTAWAANTFNKSSCCSVMGDFVPGYEASAWLGFGAPKDTPTAIIDVLNSEVNAGLADSMIKARFADLGATVLPGSPTDFGKLIAEETEKWAKVVRAANIKAE